MLTNRKPKDQSNFSPVTRISTHEELENQPVKGNSVDEKYQLRSSKPLVNT